ncbi:MAG: PD-(D/E)XK nuclease family protein [Gemmatimonadales bacterium]
MSSPTLAPPSRLLAALQQFGVAHPLERKILVAPSINWARELLRQLARRDGGWVGWEPMTLRGIADEIALLPLSEAGKQAGTDIAIGALIGEALDQAVEDHQLSSRTRELATSPGFRRALEDAVLEMRFAGIDGALLQSLTSPREPARDLAVVLDRYAQLLAAASFTDAAGVFATALDAFDVEAPLVLSGHLLLAPELSERGLPGRLLRRLTAFGAEPLAAAAADPDPGTPTASRDYFLAATPTDEVREVLRRVVAEGLRFDDVELISTDPDTYGTALDGLCRQLNLTATMLQGLPLARSRAGRALNRWLAWLEGGLPADLLRQLIESGDLDLAKLEIMTDGPTLARAFRSLQIGWGRARYAKALHAVQSEAWVAIRYEDADLDDEDPAELVRRRKQIAEDLRKLLTKVLLLAPTVDERGDLTDVHLEVAALATATLQFLELVPSEGQTTNRLRNRLQQVADVPGPARRFGAALAALRESLTDFRAWSTTSGEHQPWGSRGGALHLTDLKHAGLTGRRRLFVLGLDADRTAGPRLPDPFLPDRLREALGPERIATSGDRRSEYRELVTRTLASLSGQVTLSYAVAADLAGHETGPAPVLLEIARAVTNTPALSYTEFRTLLGAPACAVPVVPGQALDGRDRWLGAIAEQALLLDGTGAVLTAWPDLAHGVSAFAALDAGVLVPQLGLVTAAAGRHDPTTGDLGISPSSLEQLARCPLAWFYHYALRLSPPDDPEYDPGSWLDARARGALLHEIYEIFVQRYMATQSDIVADSAQSALLQIADEVLANMVSALPPPSETVRRAEEKEIKAAALSFLAMEQEALRTGPRAVWRETELRINPRQVRYALPDGSSFALKGKIDRVDELADGGLVIIDYKTGGQSYYREDPKKGLFRGARHLQPALYATAAGTLRDSPVARFEYRFPTLKGQNDRVVYSAQMLRQAPPLIQQLLRHVRDGQFVPTTDANDCKLCDFKQNCRVRLVEGSSYTTVHSPRAAWAKANAEVHPALVAMTRRRGGA